MGSKHPPDSASRTANVGRRCGTSMSPSMQMRSPATPSDSTMRFTRSFATDPGRTPCVHLLRDQDRQDAQRWVGPTSAAAAA